MKTQIREHLYSLNRLNSYEYSGIGLRDMIDILTELYDKYEKMGYTKLTVDFYSEGSYRITGGRMETDAEYNKRLKSEKKKLEKEEKLRREQEEKRKQNNLKKIEFEKNLFEKLKIEHKYRRMSFSSSSVIINVTRESLGLGVSDTPSFTGMRLTGESGMRMSPSTNFNPELQKGVFFNTGVNSWADPGIFGFNNAIFTQSAGVVATATYNLGLFVANSCFLGWGGSDYVANYSTLRAGWVAPASGIIEQRDTQTGSNAQVYRIYNTYSSTTNYERLSIDWQTESNICRISAEKGSGGGTVRTIKFVGEDAAWTFDEGGTTRFGIVKKNGYYPWITALTGMDINFGRISSYTNIGGATLVRQFVMSGDGSMNFVDSSGNSLVKFNIRTAQNDAKLLIVNESKQLIQDNLFTVYGLQDSTAIRLRGSHDAGINGTGLNSPHMSISGKWRSGDVEYEPGFNLWFSPIGIQYGRARFDVYGGELTIYCHENRIGKVGINNTTPTSQLHVIPNYSGTVGTIIQGASSQTEDLLQFRDSGDSILGYVNYAGSLKAQGLTLGYVEKTADYGLTLNDCTVNCTANSFAITLPTAVGCSGKVFIVKNSGAGTITLNTTSSQTIDGSASGAITLAQWDNRRIQSTGANWILI